MSNLDIEIGNRLRLIRESKGLNQKDFGSLLDVIPQTYSKYEKAELLRTLDSTDAGFAERFQLFGKVFSWVHLAK